MLRGSGTLIRLAAVVLLVGSSAFARARVVVLRSADLSAYSQVVAGFGSELKADLEEATLDDDGAHQSAVIQKVVSEKPALVLAVGPLAATLARHALNDVPVLFCMVPYYERYGLEAPKTTGIALTSDLSVELAALKTVFPGAKRVGILHDPRYSSAVIAQAQKTGQKLGVSIVPLAAESTDEVDRALREARGKVNALLMIADKTVGNASAVHQEIEFGRSERVPVVGFADSQVKEGATLAFSPSYTAIGQQAGRLANRIIVEKIDAGALAVSPPEVLDLAMNLRAAHALVTPAQVVEGLLNFASDHNFPVRVFQ